MPWWLALVILGWFAGWLTYFRADIDRRYESEVLFGVTFGLLLWPLLLAVHLISESARG